MKKNIKNRWLIAASAIAIHSSIGSAYAFSVFTNPLQEALGWHSTEITLAFTIAIFILGISAATFGRFVERRGPRVAASVSACLFATGLIGAGISIHFGSLIGFYAFYGVIGGIGLGIGYISPVSTLVKWFPDRRGLATGMAVLGFGAGALIASPVAAELILVTSIPTTFLILGGAYFVLMIVAASYIEKPPEGWLPAAFTPGVAGGGLVIKADLAQLTANEAIKTVRFWLLWFMMFVNISAGIMLISVASPMAQEKVGMTAIAAAAMVGFMGLFNGAGRIAWASLSDYVGRQNIFIVFFAIQLVAFLALPSVSSELTFQILIFLILTIYGGGFASLPAFLGDLFGTKQLGAIHGYILTAWSLAGIAGPLVVASIFDMTQSYNITFYIFAALLLLALGAALAMRINIQAIRANQEKAKVTLAVAEN